MSTQSPHWHRTAHGSRIPPVPQHPASRPATTGTITVVAAAAGVGPAGTGGVRVPSYTEVLHRELFSHYAAPHTTPNVVWAAVTDHQEVSTTPVSPVRASVTDLARALVGTSGPVITVDTPTDEIRALITDTQREFRDRVGYGCSAAESDLAAERAYETVQWRLHRWRGLRVADVRRYVEQEVRRVGYVTDTGTSVRSLTVAVLVIVMAVVLGVIAYTATSDANAQWSPGADLARLHELLRTGTNTIALVTAALALARSVPAALAVRPHGVRAAVHRSVGAATDVLFVGYVALGAFVLGAVGAVGAA